MDEAKDLKSNDNHVNLQEEEIESNEEYKIEDEITETKSEIQVKPSDGEANLSRREKKIKDGQVVVKKEKKVKSEVTKSEVDKNKLMRAYASSDQTLNSHVFGNLNLKLVDF